MLHLSGGAFKPSVLLVLAYETCRQDQFMCRDQRCIGYEYLCDGDMDCRDGSDEVLYNCTNLMYFYIGILSDSNV